jgi:hypothetical protein
MAKVLVDNSVCDVCRADIRPNALFCYSCGAAVGSKVETSNKNGISKKADFFIDIISEDKGAKNIAPKNIESNKANLPAAKVSDKEITKNSLPNADAQEKTKLRSAAALRRKSRIIAPKKVEISWVETENAANTWFILAALVLTAFALGIVFLALRIR